MAKKMAKKNAEKITKKQNGENAMPTATQAPAGAVAAKPVAQQSATFRYVDRPECTETFADSINGLSYDGQTLRIEFGITRPDDMKPNTPVTGRRYPACRLVLPPAAAIDLINRMQQVAAALTQAGVLKQTPKPADTGKPK